MATINYVVQGVIGLLIVAPLVFFIFKRIERLQKLNQSAQAHFDIWRDIQKSKENV